MKKTLLSLIGSLLFCITVTGQEASRFIRVQKEGQFSTQLPDNKMNKVKELHLSGKVNDEDLKYLKEEIKKYSLLSVLDLKNLSVSQLPDSAFANCESLSEVTLPSQLKNTGIATFLYCKNLKNVTMQEGIEEIGISCFYGCNSIKYIELPHGVTNIKSEAFSHCDKLSTLTIPATCQTIGKEAFAECKNLQVLRCMAILPPVCEENVFSNIDNKNCVLYVPNKTEDEYKKGIIWSSFEEVQTLKETKNTATIVKSENEEETMTVFNRRAGQLKKQLSFNWLLAKRIKFRGPINADDIYFLRELANYNGGGKLEVLDMSATTGIDKLKDSAFISCKSLTTIILPNCIKTIGADAFNGCTSLTNIRLPQQLKEISHRAFKNCKNLKTIYIPSEVNRIGDQLFYGCSNLTAITLPEFLLTIPQESFSGCTKLTDISLPDHLKNIEKCAFLGCRSLKNISLPDETREIGESAFEDCSSLTRITLPEEIREVREKTFWGCKQLETVILPNNLQEIKAWAFKDCQKLNNLILDKGLKSIGEKAFEDCNELNEITCLAETPPACQTTTFNFDDAHYKQCTLRVPENCKSLYILGDAWWVFKTESLEQK